MPVDLKLQYENNASAFSKIGGLDAQIKELRELIEVPLLHPELFKRMGVNPVKGVIISGSPGTGKTTLAAALAKDAGAFRISCPAGDFTGSNGASVVNNLFETAIEENRKIRSNENKDASGVIILIDELETIGSSRVNGLNSSNERNLTATLLSNFDLISKEDGIFVIGTTNMLNVLDLALRRPGRFDKEIKLPIPDEKARQAILEIKMKDVPLDKDVNINEVAWKAHGYTGADLDMLVKEAVFSRIRELPENLLYSRQKISDKSLSMICVKKSDFDHAFGKVVPTSMREIFIERPNLHWEDIGGIGNIKEELKLNIMKPMKDAVSFKTMGIRPIRGAILSGPPGNGKTLIGKVLATESGANFIYVKGPEVLSSFVGSSEGNVRRMFERARQASPCILFIDEIDAIGKIRDNGILDSGVANNVVASLLTEMDGYDELKNVFVLGATNRVDLIDPALLRPGRFDMIIEVPLPNEDARKDILKIHSKKMPLDKDAEEMLENEIAKETSQFSGADLANLCREAGMNAIKNAKKVVTVDDLGIALSKSRRQSTLSESRDRNTRVIRNGI